MIHICGDEIAMAVALLPGLGAAARWLRIHLARFHQHTDACPHDSAQHREEAGNSQGAKHHPAHHQSANG